MAGNATGGNKLSPNRNVTAVAGNGGDKWGANGGGITPIGGGVTGQGGWDTPESNELATGQGQFNYLVGGTAPRTATRSIASDASRGALGLGVADTSLPAGGSNAG